jgi:hypothetical protein
LESKFIDLKRAHSEADARNERLELEVEAMRKELLKVVENPNANVEIDRSVLSFSTSSSIRGAQKKEEKQKLEKQQGMILQEFATLCENVEQCEKCKEHIPQTTLDKVKERLALGESQRDGEEDDNIPRHEGARAIVAGLQEKNNKKSDSQPFGKFAHVHEPKSEQMLRGKKSQFVAAQSGVYCRIDHDMKKPYGDVDQLQAPSKLHPRPPPGAKVDLDPPELIAGIKARNEVVKKDNPPKLPPQRPPSAPPSEAEPSISLPTPEKRGDRRKREKKPPIRTIDLQGSYRTIISEMNDSTMPQPLASTIDQEGLTFEEALIFDADSPTGVAELEPKEYVKEDPPAQPRKSHSMDTDQAKRDSMEADRSSSRKESLDNRLSSMEGSGVTNSTRRTGVTNAAAAGDDELEPSERLDEDLLVGRVKKIPPAKLDPAEKKAKREAAVREAKAAAKNVRKKNRGPKFFDSKSKDADSFQDGADSSHLGEENSLISGLSNVSSVAEVKRPRTKLFKNPFKKKKSSLGGFVDDIPMEIIEEVPTGRKIN